MTMSTIDAATRVQTLIALTEELSAIIAEENALLSARRPRELSALQPDKARLAAAYAQSIRQIAADRGSVAGAGASLIEELRRLTKTFEERAERQRALLGAARAASESVVRAIADEAARTDEPGYGGAPAPRAAPIVVDDRA